MKQEKAEMTLDVGDLLGFGFAIIVLAIGLAYGLQVLGDIQVDMGDASCSGYYNPATNVCQANATNTTAVGSMGEGVNATIDGINATAKIPGKLGIIVTVFIASVVIGFLVRYLWKAIAE